MRLLGINYSELILTFQVIVFQAKHIPRDSINTVLVYIYTIPLSPTSCAFSPAGASAPQSLQTLLPGQPWSTGCFRKPGGFCLRSSSLLVIAVAWESCRIARGHFHFVYRSQAAAGGVGSTNCAESIASRFDMLGRICWGAVPARGEVTTQTGGGSSH